MQNTLESAQFSADNSEIVEFPIQKKTGKKKTSKHTGVWYDKTHDCWQASAGTHPTTKKRIIKGSFPTAKEAKDWRASEIRRLKDRIYESRRLNDAESLECLAGIKLLEKHNLLFSGVITSAFEEYVMRHPESNPTTVGIFFEEWLKYKEATTTSPQTVFSAKSKIRAFINKHLEKPLTEITQRECEEFCFDSQISRTTQGNRLGYLKDYFSYAQDLGKIGSEKSAHPCIRLKKPKTINTFEDKVPWSLSDFEKLLRFSLENEDLYFATAHLLIGGYAGVRMNEMRQLKFEKNGVDLDRGEIYISATVAKTKASRIIPMHPSLLSSLTRLRDRPRAKPRKFCREVPRPTDLGSSVFSPKLMDSFRSMLPLPSEEGGASLPIVDEGGAVRKDSLGREFITSPSSWIKNGLRSSFATYHYMLGGSAERTAQLMGHSQGLNVFFNHYRRMAREDDGKRFFEIAERVFDEVLNR